jgi:hypothetical protein
MIRNSAETERLSSKKPCDLTSRWKPTHLTSIFSLQTSVFTSPHGTTLTAFADVRADVSGC